MRKRILLMYITDVSGHRSAALAIEKALKILSPSVEIMSINAFKYTNPISERIVNRIYTTVIKKTPKIWDYMYDNPGLKKKLEALKHFIHRSNSPKLAKLFDSFQPEIVHIQDHFPLSRDVLHVAQRHKVKLIGTNHFMPENLSAYVPVVSKIKPVYNWIMWSWMLDVYNRLGVATAQSKASA